jgi:hypothetical protein
VQVPVLDRRDALRKAAAMFGMALTAPLAGAIAACTNPGATAENPVFTDGQRALTAALAERIIPTTDTPGAIDAGVPDFIEMMLGDFYPPIYRESFMAGMTALDDIAKEMHDAGFAALTAEQQDAILTKADAGELPQLGEDFWTNAKQLTVTGYYSSEIGMTQERVYLPVPGKYDGDYPYESVGKLFAG